MFLNFTVEVSVDLDKTAIGGTKSAQSAIQSAMTQVVEAACSISCVTTAKATLTLTATKVANEGTK